MEVDEVEDASGDEVASLAPKTKPAAPGKKKTASETYTKVGHTTLFQYLE